MHASHAALPVNSDRPDVDTRLPALLAQTVGDVATGSRPAGRTAVRRRVALLRRRRRLRRVLGSSTLAAGMVAGGVHTRLDGHTSPVATVPATPAVPGGGAPLTRPTSALAPAQPATSWSWDPGEGVDREAADPGALYADGGFHVYATSATHCLRGGCRVYRVPRFGSPEPALPGRLEGDAMPGRPDWVAPDDDAIWAPAAARIGDRYVLYFAASSAGRATPP